MPNRANAILTRWAKLPAGARPPGTLRRADLGSANNSTRATLDRSRRGKSQPPRVYVRIASAPAPM